MPAHLYIYHHKPFLLSEPGSTFCCNIVFGSFFLLIIFLKIFVLGILVFIIILPFFFIILPCSIFVFFIIQPFIIFVFYIVLASSIFVFYIVLPLASLYPS